MKSHLLPSYFNIIPVRDKKPQIMWNRYIDNAQTHLEKAEIERHYGEYDKGIITGPISRIFVLDDDGGLDEKLYRVPKTWTVHTPRGGKHHYFKWVSALDSKVTTKTDIFQKKREEDPGVDVRGHGGYVVFYGFDRPYMSLPLAAPPQWLIDLLPNKDAKEASVSSSQIQDLLDGIKSGNRNDSFTRLAGSLRARGYGVEEMMLFLLPKAREVEFPESELQTICQSVGRYAPRVSSEAVEDFSAVLSENLKTEWLASPQIISKQSITFLVGLPEACKTWMLMDLALAAATGGEWLGKFKCKPSTVLYLDQERSRASTIERFNQLVAGRGLNSKALNGKLILKPQSRVKLNLPQSFEAFDRLLEKTKPELVLVDSFKKFHSGNELSSQDMQALFTRTEELKDKHGCSFVFIHHETKGVIQKRKEDFNVRAEDAAGTIDLQQTAEHFFNAIQHSDGSMLYHTKNNLGNKVQPILVKVVDQDADKTSIKLEAF